MKKMDCSHCRGSGTIKYDDCGGVGTVHIPARTRGESRIYRFPVHTVKVTERSIDCPHCNGTDTGTP